jgi:hypothetical protein
LRKARLISSAEWMASDDESSSARNASMMARRSDSVSRSSQMIESSWRGNSATLRWTSSAWARPAIRILSSRVAVRKRAFS